jgi:hypothetical protein
MDLKYLLANGWSIVENSIGMEFRNPTSAVFAPIASANGVEYVPVIPDIAECAAPSLTELLSALSVFLSTLSIMDIASFY